MEVKFTLTSYMLLCFVVRLFEKDIFENAGDWDKIPFS